jgi:hypothetical protein
MKTRSGKVLRPPEDPFQRLPRLLLVRKPGSRYRTCYHPFYLVITQDARAILDFRKKQHEMRQPESKFSSEFWLSNCIRESLETLAAQH